MVGVGDSVLAGSESPSSGWFLSRHGSEDHLDTEGSGEAHDGGEAGVSVGGEGFVKALPAHTNFPGEGAYVLCSYNILQGGSYDVTVAWVFLRTGFNIEPGVVHVLETFGRVPICVSFR